MTIDAVHAATAFHGMLAELAAGLSDSEWLAASACPGWRVRDVYAHLGATARNAVDPIPLPEERLPLPSVRERQHDVHVDIRRSWSIDEVRREFTETGQALLGALAYMQDEPQASQEIEIPGLGRYLMHQAASGIAFDFYCHLVHDVLQPRGPVGRPAPEVTDEQMRPVVEWMLLGLPQMQGPELDASLVAPLTFRLTGPGGGAWTVTRPDPSGGLVVAAGATGSVTVTSSTADFVAWATGRVPWFDRCTIDGSFADAAGFLSTLDIV